MQRNAVGVFLWHAWVFATLEIDKSCYLSQEKLLCFVYVSWMFERDFWDDMRYNLVFFISHCQTWSFTMLSSSSCNSSTLSTSPILDSASYHNPLPILTKESNGFVVAKNSDNKVRSIVIDRPSVHCRCSLLCHLAALVAADEAPPKSIIRERNKLSSKSQ